MILQISYSRQYCTHIQLHHNGKLTVENRYLLFALILAGLALTVFEMCCALYLFRTTSKCSGFTQDLKDKWLFRINFSWCITLNAFFSKILWMKIKSNGHKTVILELCTKCFCYLNIFCFRNFCQEFYSGIILTPFISTLSIRLYDKEVNYDSCLIMSNCLHEAFHFENLFSLREYLENVHLMQLMYC